MDGILLINKEKNCTSRDVVNKLVKKLNTKKIGHTGTLDPIATGVLVVCVGRATKLVDELTSLDKEYIAEVLLGTLTDTLDNTGNIIKEESVNLIDEQIISAVKSMIGQYEQEVPIYSAVKINGKKLYEYARENIKIELPKRLVNIFDIELIDDIKREDKKIRFKIRCHVSKGTYIRSLVYDISKKLNTIGIMTDLTRTKQGKFLLNNCINVEDASVQNMLSAREIITDILQVKVDDTLKKDILNGKIIHNEYNASRIMFISSDNKALAIYKEYEKDKNMLKPDIMLGGI